MKPGETPYQSAARLLKRELGLELSASDIAHEENGGRFRGVGHYSYLWEMREQAPQGNGTADISSVLTIQLTDSECANFKMDAKEYGENKWISPNEVLEEINDYHPALKQSIFDYLTQLELRKLSKEAKQTPTANPDAHYMELGKKFAHFCDRFSSVKSYNALLKGEEAANSKSSVTNGVETAASAESTSDSKRVKA